MPKEKNEQKKNYKAILFDLGNTIIRFDHHISAKKIADLSSKTETEIYHFFFDSETTRLFDAGKLSPEEFYATVAKALNLEVRFEDFASIWSNIFWLDEGSYAIAKKLKERYKLFLISNINKLHFEYIMRHFDAMRIFDEFILSYIVGCLKPDIRIYEEAARLGNAKFSDLLYIDDREDLVLQSNAFGIDSIRFENAPALRSELTARGIIIDKI